MHVGNDVVDLNTPGTKDKIKDNRFLHKVLTPDEKQAVLSAKDAGRYLWAFWAAKEAAYKAVSKHYPHATAAPRRYSVVLTANAASAALDGIVNSPYGRVWVRVFKDSDRVHCIGAYQCTGSINEIVWGLDRMRPHTSAAGRLEADNESLRVRQMAADRISAYLRLEPELVEIKRKKGLRRSTPPEVYVSGRQTKFDISLSHHGRFGAYAFWAPC
jgi:phosphopantetheine--protein transferase-like protein